MLEDAETSTSAAPCRQKSQRKKRGRLFYTTPKELLRSRMRRSNILPRFSTDHGDTLRTLDFQDLDT
jgi:hypothetical protein